MSKLIALCLVVLWTGACSSSSSVHESNGGDAGSGGRAGSGGNAATGSGTGGASGGGSGSGGAAGTGGEAATAAVGGSGAVSGSAGTSASGGSGAVGTGGASGSGGESATGGAGTGGDSGMGGAGAGGVGATSGSGGTGGAPCGELLADGGFDTVPSAWTLFSTTGRQVITHFSNTELAVFDVTPHSGEYLAWFGNVHNDTSVLSQSITLPVGVDSLTLSGRLRISSAEEIGQGMFDVARIQLVEGTLVRVEAAVWSNEDVPSNLTSFEVPVDVATQAGKTLTFRVVASTDSNLLTSFWFDTLSLTSCAP